MELSVQQFLDSVSNPNTKKGYRHGVKKFCEWYGKSAEEILELRKDDLTQRAGEGLIEYKNRATRFEKEIEKFHSYLLSESFTINTARNMTLGIRQLFRFYEMGISFRAGSKVSKTVKTTRSFPLVIEHVRTMFEVADLRERVILSMATDLGFRMSDFIALKKKDLPALDQKPPISFEVMTDKEDVIAHGFLSQETVNLLKVYLPTLQKKNSNVYLFPSNGQSHISDEWMNRLILNLAVKAQIPLNDKALTFHCFRKMFLSTSADVGLFTAGKKIVGKAIPQSDDTYLTTVKLKDAFLRIKAQLTIQETVKPENHERLEQMQTTIVNQQKEIQDATTRIDALVKNLEKQQTEMEKMKTHQNTVDHVLDLLDLTEEDTKIISEMILDYRERKMKMEEAEAQKQEDEEKNEILDRGRK